MNAKQIIENHNATIESSYVLVNNWGHVIRHNGVRYDVRRWANCYGSDIGWGVDRIPDKDNPVLSDAEKEWRDILYKTLNNRKVNNEW